MKKTLFALLVACLFVVLFVGCSAEPEEQQKTTYVMKVKVEVTGTHSAWSNTYYSKGSVLAESKSAKKAEAIVKYELFTDEACTQKVTDKDNPFVSYYFTKDGDKYAIAFGDSVKMKFNSTMTVSGTDITLAKDTTYTLTESKDGDKYSVTITVPENLTAKFYVPDTYIGIVVINGQTNDKINLNKTLYIKSKTDTTNLGIKLYTDEACTQAFDYCFRVIIENENTFFISIVNDDGGWNSGSKNSTTSGISLSNSVLTFAKDSVVSFDGETGEGSSGTCTVTFKEETAFKATQDVTFFIPGAGPTLAINGTDSGNAELTFTVERGKTIQEAIDAEHLSIYYQSQTYPIDAIKINGTSADLSTPVTEDFDIYIQFGG